MTVIVAARTKAGITMAADSAVTRGWIKATHDAPKLWVQDKWLAGGAGTMRHIQVVRHFVTLPKFRPDEDTHWETFMVRNVIPALRTGVKDHGIVLAEKGHESIEATHLFAVGEHMAYVSYDGCVLTEPSGRMAIGSGEAEALGFLGDGGTYTEADVVEAVRRAAVTAHGVDGAVMVADTKTLKVREARA